MSNGRLRTAYANLIAALWMAVGDSVRVVARRRTVISDVAYDRSISARKRLVEYHHRQRTSA